MRMDGMIAHILARLDAIRETQLRHGQLLDRIAEAIAALRTSSSAPPMSGASWMPIARGVGQWAGGILALAYLARGGDAGKALDLLQKLF
jgi:hypothetical protein